jgi:predicted flap endonuclease-1-like 5' DNA nuclease
MEETTMLTTNDLPKLGEPATRALHAAGYTRLDQFAQVKAADLLKLHGVGPKAIRLLKEAMAERGLSFADESARPRS